MLEIILQQQDAFQNSSWLTATIFIGAIVAALIFYLTFGSSKDKEPKQEVVEEKVKKQPTQEQPKKEKKEKVAPIKKVPESETHPLRFSTLKGFKNDLNFVTWSPNNAYVAVASNERFMLLFETATLGEKAPKFIHVNLPFDSASAGVFSQDSHHMVVALTDSHEIVAYQMVKKDGKTSMTEVRKFKTQHKESIKCISISSNNKVILTSDEGTIVYLWSLKGQLLTTVNTNQIRNNTSAITPDSKLFAVTAWTGEVKVWQILNNKESGDFEKVQKTMDLGEHKSTVYSIAFSSDSSKAVTTSKDGTFKVWKIDVRYTQGEDAKCIKTVNCPVEKKAFNLIALSSDSKTIACTINSSIYFYTIDGNLVSSIENAHEGTINSLCFSADSSLLATISSTEHVGKVWKNPNKL